MVPGKLFIVGDPKQSIYAFRRADIAAFDQVVAALIKGGALVCTLTTNFRSHGNILQVVNAVFEELFIQKNQVQPPHIPLEVGRESAGLSRAGSSCMCWLNQNRSKNGCRTGHEGGGRMAG